MNAQNAVNPIRDDYIVNRMHTVETVWKNAFLDDAICIKSKKYFGEGHYLWNNKKKVYDVLI